ncbi:MAG: hypothetical protein H7256_02135 [Bdellovibrio sp.]|nr:hypothetical protein [Bdellovibrio sp.]
MGTKNLWKHLWIALAIGFLFRFFSAYFVFGPQALDDYLNQLIPSYKFAQGLPHLLPAWRSPLVVWMIGTVIKVAQEVGITSPVGQVQAVYLFLGAFSLTAFLGCYYFFKAVQDERAGVVAVYFTALHGLMPFVSTRAFLESMSMGPLTLGLGLLIWAVVNEKRFAIVAALFSIGIATLIRFQVGSIYVAVLVWILFFHRKFWKEVLLTSVLILGINAGIDWLDNRVPFSTLIEYLRTNKDVSKYGVQPWYSTWAAWLVIGFVPFSLPLLFQWRVLMKKGFKEILFFILIFVLAHSLVPHKEERFMYPIFAVSLWMWAALWVHSSDQKGFKTVVRPILLFINFIILAVGCFINTQVGEVGVPAKLSRQSSRVLYLDRNSLVGQGQMSEYFIRAGSSLERRPAIISNDELMNQWGSKEFEAIAIMTSQTEILPELNLLSSQDFKNMHCSETQEESSFVDGIIYRMNPKRNQRRKPTWFVVCSDLAWLRSHGYKI